MQCSSTHLTQLFQVIHKLLQSSVPTTNNWKKKKKKTPPDQTIKPHFHPVSMVLQSQLSLFKYSPNRVLLSGREEEGQGGDTGQAKVAKSHNWIYYFFIPWQIITIFSPPNCSDRPMFRKYPKNFNNPGSGEKCPYLRSVACQIYSVLFYLKPLK